MTSSKIFTETDIENRASEKLPEQGNSNTVSTTTTTTNNKTKSRVLIVFGTVVLLELAAVIVLAVQLVDSNNHDSSLTTLSGYIPTTKPPVGDNYCEGKKPDLPNVDCVIDAVTNVGPQSGANVTRGYQGEMQVDSVPVETPYFQAGMCAVNVHWHLGTEHYSAGEFDEFGSGPNSDNHHHHDDDEHDRRLSGDDDDVREGYRCHHYDETDPIFTTPYQWQHCENMHVGETYEVHWPHSAAGACGTPNQYQTPFYDGVFCRDGVLIDTAAQIGVQAQVFTIVNDEDYYYPDLMRGMIVDGTYGQDIAKYPGSTTGTSRNNEVCSQFSPITWQVDRQCHLISASSFDKMCADMKAQRDDMTEDLAPHGSRELVDDKLAANNFHRVRRF